MWGSLCLYPHLDPTAGCCGAQRYLLAIPQTPEGLRLWAGAEKGWVARIWGSALGADGSLVHEMDRGCRPCGREGAAEAMAAIGGPPSTRALARLPPPSPSAGCRAGEELVKISALYPEDTNAMQISFATLQAGSDGLVGGFRAPPVTTEGQGMAMAELRFK